MITKREFYFVRHGETDHNAGLYLANDHPLDMPLNEAGKAQSYAIQPKIARLPIQTVCASPLRRVQETKEIITKEVLAPHHSLVELTECSTEVWREMGRLRTYSSFSEETLRFIHRVRDGINQALALPGPILVIAHGGVHFACCSLLEIEDHPWAIENCALVHFQPLPDGKWSAKKL